MASSSVSAAVSGRRCLKRRAERDRGGPRGLRRQPGSRKRFRHRFRCRAGNRSGRIGRVLAAAPGDRGRGTVLVVGAGQKSAHEVLVLSFHQPHEFLLEPGLADKIVVRCPPGGEDGSLVVEQRDHDRIAYPVVFGLHVVGLSAVFEVGIEPGHHCHYLRAEEYSTNAAVSQLFVRLVFFVSRGPFGIVSPQHRGHFTGVLSLLAS